MPILPVEQFKALYLTFGGLSSTLTTGRRRKNNEFPNLFLQDSSKSSMHTLIFCLNDCDSILAIRILKLHNLSIKEIELDFDIFYITGLNDIYSFIDEQQRITLETPNIKLKTYTRIILMGFGGHCYIDINFFATIQNHFTNVLKDDKDKENLQFWIFDFKRPFHSFFESDNENWFLIIDNDEHQNWLETKENADHTTENISSLHHMKRKKSRLSKVQFSSSSAFCGIYVSLPLCYLINQIVSDVGVNKAIYAKKEFLTSISLYWHYNQQYIDLNDYEELLNSLRKDLRYGRIYQEDEFAISTKYGILPFLQYSSLEDALKASEHLFVRSHDEDDIMRENDIRLHCGVTRREMKLHQSEFRITNKEAAIQQHLQVKYGDPVSTIDWARIIHPDLNNAAFSYMASFVLSFSSDYRNTQFSRIGNCRDLQQIIETLIKIDYSCDAKVESQLLDALFPVSQLHLIQTFSKIKNTKFESKRCGGEIVLFCSLVSTISTHFHHMQLRQIALLCTSYKAKGDKMKSSSIIMSISNPNSPDYVLLYAINPISDKENPDLWPEILFYLSLKGLLIQNEIHPNMAKVITTRLSDVKSQMLDLYKQRHNPEFLKKKNILFASSRNLDLTQDLNSNYILHSPNNNSTINDLISSNDEYTMKSKDSSNSLDIFSEEISSNDNLSDIFDNSEGLKKKKRIKRLRYKNKSKKSYSNDYLIEHQQETNDKQFLEHKSKISSSKNSQNIDLNNISYQKEVKQNKKQHYDISDNNFGEINLNDDAQSDSLGDSNNNKDSI